MNCTREESAKIVEEHWEEAWNHIKSIPLPDKREKEITDEEMIRELDSLCKNDLSVKANSKIVHKFFPSMATANKEGKLSPAEYWTKLQGDPELFKVFYENRIRCSDWFKEKDNMKYLNQGYVPDFIYAIGLSSSQKSPYVSYFKPAFAKDLVKKYLYPFNTIFDPFCGYGGRLLGSIAAGKSYIGYDLNDITIIENNNLIKWIDNKFPSLKGLNKAAGVADAFSATGKYECLLTCPPYSDSKGVQIEEWMSSTGKITCNFTCDQIIDKCLRNYECQRYVFVVDDSCKTYREYIKEKLHNVNYINARKGSLTDASNNFEAIIVIDKFQRNQLIGLTN